MVEEKQLTCCLRCKKLKFGDGEWVQVDPSTIDIIAKALTNGCCDLCADSVYDEMTGSAVFEGS